MLSSTATAGGQNKLLQASTDFVWLAGQWFPRALIAGTAGIMGIYVLANLAYTLVLSIGYLMQPFTPRKRALHDFIAGTVITLGSLALAGEIAHRYSASIQVDWDVLLPIGRNPAPPFQPIVPFASISFART